MKKQGACYIVGAGEFTPLYSTPAAEDYVIAADGGYRYLQQIGIHPDLVLGDFDSLPKKPQHDNLIELPAEKDDTDMLYALKVGLEKGFRIFYLYGGMGGRFDHTIANLQSLAFLSQNGAVGFLFGKEDVTTVLSGPSVCFDSGAEGYFSLFSFGEHCEGVCIRGLKYELENASLCHTFPIGTSNEFIQKESEITIAKGMAAMVFAQKNLAHIKRIEQRLDKQGKKGII